MNPCDNLGHEPVTPFSAGPPRYDRQPVIPDAHDIYQAMRVAADLARVLIASGCEVSWCDADYRGARFAADYFLPGGVSYGTLPELERRNDRQVRFQYGRLWPIMLAAVPIG